MHLIYSGPKVQRYYSGPKVQSFLFSTLLFSQTNGAEKRTNGAEKRTNGAEKRTIGAEKRTNGAEKRTNGAEKRTNGAGKRTNGVKKRSNSVEKRTNGAEKRKCTLGPPYISTFFYFVICKSSFLIEPQLTVHSEKPYYLTLFLKQFSQVTFNLK